ncbi:MAG TPA: hypothetical protein PL168_06850 [Methanobacterium sp.]|jgi:hypothetical protein|nr:hypothetical protein [Methanobacterium sp.]
MDKIKKDILKKDILKIFFVLALSFIICFILILIFPRYIALIVLILFVVVIGVGSLIISSKTLKILGFSTKK